ncbi:MAG: carboxymuconolactone decarboxylase family protein [Sphingorhabdus sp.]
MAEDSRAPDAAKSRIKLLEEHEMTPEQLDNYRNTASGKLNLSRLLGQARTMQPGLQAMVSAMMTDITIPPDEREIVILAVLQLDRGAYEWAQHQQVAAEMGITKAKVDAIAAERFSDPMFNHRERALLAFTRQVVKFVRVDDVVFNELSSFYDDRQLVELIEVIGIYMMILRVSEVAELEVDAVHGADVWKEAARQAK